MLEISDLGLTPRQYTEVTEADPILVEAWLVAVSGDGVTNPAAWFLTGLRSGVGPEQRYDSDRARQIHLAERWMERVGLLFDRERDALGELFDERGLLRYYGNDELLRQRMAQLWAKHRPRGEQTEQEQRERNERFGEAYRELHKTKT